MFNKKAIDDAKRFFRREAYYHWGYLVRKRKPQERTAPEDTIDEARQIYRKAIDDSKRIYRGGIRNAWAIYTKDDITAKEAKEALNKAINQADQLYFPEHVKLFYKAIRQVHDEYAEKVADKWKAFVEDMRRKY